MADLGSLAKASEQLYLSKPAVLKQINALENEIGMALFKRSHQGFSLTEAGEIFYADAKKMIQLAHQTMEKLQAFDPGPKQIIRLGSSFLNPASAFIQFWERIRYQHPQFQIMIVPYEDAHNHIDTIIQSIGTNFDFYCGIYDTPRWDQYCQFLKLKDCRFYVAVRDDHPLAEKRSLTISQLTGYRILLPAYRENYLVSQFEDHLKEQAPQLQLAHTPANYDLDTFNQILNSDDMLISFDCWKDIHPSVKTIPLKCPDRIAFGLVYAKKPRPEVQALIQSIARHLHL